jgi:hypothetical protein
MAVPQKTCRETYLSLLDQAPLAPGRAAITEVADHLVDRRLSTSHDEV